MRPYIGEMMSDMMMSGMSIEDKIKESEDGDPDCMENLAQAYLNGDGDEQDLKKSAYWKSLQRPIILSHSSTSDCITQKDVELPAILRKRQNG